MPDLSREQFRDKAAGVLLGTALGDALGFIAEQMDGDSIAARFGNVERFYVLGNHGFVTDDTEQSALIAYCLARNSHDRIRCVSDFRRCMLFWFLSMPFGMGKATSQACTKILLGMKNSATLSAGNGAAMRAAPIGVYFYDDAASRASFGMELAKVTHGDDRAVEGALFVAELASLLCKQEWNSSLHDCFLQALQIVGNSELKSALEKAADLAQIGSETGSAAQILNRRPPAFIINSLAFATFCFLRWGNGPVLSCLSETIAGGGDTDTNAAIVGAWCGALHGENALPAELIARIDDGPFGPTHLRRLADALTDAKYGGQPNVPNYSVLHSAARNVLLIPVILTHAVCRLVPLPKMRS
jgi:ADP-ribosyl-[dinitrogen reductase] hydrolase